MIKRVQKVYKYPYFVETGTYLGETPLALRNLFNRIWTIELDEQLYLNAKRRLSKYSNIICIHGDSKDVLSEIIEQLDKPTLFWLDAHYSGGVTAKGEIAAPLLQELQLISKSNIKEHVIVIDAISDFSIKEENTPLSKIIAKLESINPSYKFYFDYDMLFALPNEGQHREFWRKIAYPIVVR